MLHIFFHMYRVFQNNLMNLWDLMKADKMLGEVWWKLFWEEDSLDSENLSLREPAVPLSFWKMWYMNIKPGISLAIFSQQRNRA